ncbi:MAG: hypothetical protein V1811_02775, partial [Candidatus Micrarchaeota archaeon]
NIIFKFSGTMVSTYAFGFSSTSAVFAGLTMLPVGEFSLLVASQGAGAVGLDLVGITAAMVFTSALTTSLLAGKHAKIHAFLYALTPTSIKTTGRRVSSRMALAVRAFEPGAALHKVFEKTAMHVAENLAGLSVLIGIGAAAWVFFSRDTVSLFGFSVSAFTATILILAAISIKPLFEIIRELTAAGSALRRNLERDAGRNYGSKLAWRFGFIIFAIIAVLMVPFFLAFLKTSRLLQIVPAALILLVVAGFLFLGKADNKENIMFFKR